MQKGIHTPFPIEWGPRGTGNIMLALFPTLPVAEQSFGLPFADLCSCSNI